MIDAKRKERILRARKRKAKRRLQRREFVNSFKKEKGCKVCGYNEDASNLMLIEWPGPVRFRVSYLIKKCINWPETLERINKCDVYCRKHVKRSRRIYSIIE